MGQLAQERAEKPTRTFGANTEKKPREECKAVMTQAQKNAQEARTMTEDEETEDKTEELQEEGKPEEEEKKKKFTMVFVNVILYYPGLIKYMWHPT